MDQKLSLVRLLGYVSKNTLLAIYVLFRPLSSPLDGHSGVKTGQRDV